MNVLQGMILEFMGGSTCNVPQAFPIYLICLRWQ